MGIQQQLQNSPSRTRFSRSRFVEEIKAECFSVAAQQRQCLAEENRERNESLVGEHDMEHVSATAQYLEGYRAVRVNLAERAKNLVTFLEQEPSHDTHSGKVIVTREGKKRHAHVVIPEHDEGYGIVSAAAIEDRLGVVAKKLGFAEINFCSDSAGRGKALLGATVGSEIPDVGKVVKIYKH